MSEKQGSKVRGVFRYCLFIALIGIMPAGIAAQGGVDLDVVKIYPDEAFALKVCDLDSDGYDDLVYAGAMNSDLRIIYGGPNGTFEAPVSYPMNANYIEEVYLNQDQNLDLVINGMSSNYFVINNGNRSYTIDSIPHEFNNLGGIAVGYFNDDAYADIITSLGGKVNNQADYTGVIMYGDGSGGILSTQTLPFQAFSIYVSDFNNDYRDDFIALDSKGKGTIILNAGNGTYLEEASFDMSTIVIQGSASNPVADFNHDGNADFAFVSMVNNLHPEYGSHVKIGYCDGQGGIDSIRTIPLEGRSSQALSISDVNRDNNLDLLIPDIWHNKLDVFFSDAQGSFSFYCAVDLHSDSLMLSIAPADFNRDGNPDYAVGGYFYNDSINLIMNNLPPENILEPIMEVNAYNNVRISIDNPGGFNIDRDYCTVAGGKLTKVDWNNDQVLDERIVDRNLQNGTYNIKVKAKPVSRSGGTFSSDIKIGEKTYTLFKDHPLPHPSDIYPGGGSIESFTIPFIYEETSPISPMTGERVNRNVVLDWSGLGLSGDDYSVRISDRVDLSGQSVYFDNLKEGKFKPEIDWTTDMVYYWWVNSAGGDWQGPFAMYVVAPSCGDIDCDGKVGMFDIAKYIRYKFANGPEPCDLDAADVNRDGMLNIMDVISLISYSYQGGSVPICE